MGQDVIKHARLRNLRLLQDMSLDLDGSSVLVGENGSGRSTFVEGFEVLLHVGAIDPGGRTSLHRCASRPDRLDRAREVVAGDLSRRTRADHRAPRRW